MAIEDDIKRAEALYNEGRIDEYLSFFDADVEFDTGWSSGRGRDKLRPVLERQMAMFAHWKVRVENVIAQDDRVAIEFSLSGPTPDGQDAAEARTVSSRAVHMIKARDGLITELRRYYHASLFAQLGMSRSTPSG